MRMLRRTLDHLRADAVAPSAAAPVTSSAAAAVEMPTDVAGVITPEEIRDFKGAPPFCWPERAEGAGQRAGLLPVVLPAALCSVGQRDYRSNEGVGGEGGSGEGGGFALGESPLGLCLRALAVGLIMNVLRTQRTATS